jgi:uncharacterized C2H2 Zn-finger protein
MSACAHANDTDSASTTSTVETPNQETKDCMFDNEPNGIITDEKGKAECTQEGIIFYNDEFASLFISFLHCMRNCPRVELLARRFLRCPNLDKVLKEQHQYCPHCRLATSCEAFRQLFDEVETVGMELKDKQKVNGIITGQFRKLCKALEKEGMRLESFEPEISVPAKNVDLWESLAK